MLNSWSHLKFLNLWTLRMKSYAVNFYDLMEYITMCLDSTNKLEHCCA
jgi:hypothetical protein